MKEKGWIKGLVKDTLIIFIITLIAGGLLGFVNELTKEPIALQEANAKAAACNEVFLEEGADGSLTQVVSLTFQELDESRISALKGFMENQYGSSIYLTEAYEALKEDGSLYGYVLGITTKEGYGGEIGLYMGVTTEGTLKGVSLLSIAETPGLGMNAEAVLIPQYRNVTTDAFTVVKGGAMSDSEIDAITSATITSDAVTGAVNAGLEVFRELTKGGES
ncbi:MAG: FMN-binding protein [Lachnospiraceae bacterium]|nr:FMN-binding protein [Lachnospiraceae bacterium]